MFWGLSIIWIVCCGVVGAVYFSDHSLFNPLPYLPIGVVALYALSGINIIKEWMRRPVLLFGKYNRTAGPGFCWIEPAFHSVMSDVSVQDVTQELHVENVQTHDNVRLNIFGVLTTRIHPDNVRSYVVEVKDAERATTQRANTAVTEIVGRYTLDRILNERDTFSVQVQEALRSKVQVWGIDVKAVEIKDLKVADPDIERSIAMKAKAIKEAEAELKRAEMQAEIATQLQIAAQNYDESAWRLKGLEVLIEMSRSAQNNTIMIPTDLLSSLAKISLS